MAIGDPVSVKKRRNSRCFQRIPADTQRYHGAPIDSWSTPVERTNTISDYVRKSSPAINLDQIDDRHQKACCATNREIADLFRSTGKFIWDDSADAREFADALPTIPATLYAELRASKRR